MSQIWLGRGYSRSLRGEMGVICRESTVAFSSGEEDADEEDLTQHE